MSCPHGIRSSSLCGACMAIEALADEEEMDAELAPWIEALRRCLAEAGFPDAPVYFEATGIFTDHDQVPVEVWDRACELVAPISRNAVVPSDPQGFPQARYATRSN